MPEPASYGALAFNPVPDSENRIHSDEIARAHGFRGGLVPGVVVSAYLLHPAAVAWGRAFADRGRSHVVVRSPVYDGEAFEVEVTQATECAYEAVLVDPRGVRCAHAEVALPDASEVPAPPRRRGDPVLSKGAARPEVSREAMDALRQTGMRALPARWSADAELTDYLRDPAGMAPVYRDEGVANPAYVLGLSNWVLGQNVELPAWLHLETTAQHHRAIAPGEELVVEAAVADLFEKKGHAFVDLDVGVHPRTPGPAVAEIRLRAIYQLRQP